MGDASPLVNAARSAVIEDTEVHERVYHDGVPCPEHRLSVIAFLCHALGLHPASMDDLGKVLASYEEQHRRGHRHPWLDGHNGHRG